MDPLPKCSKECSEVIGFTRYEMFHLLANHFNDNANKTYEIIETALSEQLCRSYALSADEKQTIRKLLHSMRKKWQEARRTAARFLNRNTDWLSTFVAFGNNKELCAKSEILSPEVCGCSSQSFENSSEWTKRRKTADICRQSTTAELAFAAADSPTEAPRYKQSVSTIPENRYSPDAALSLLIDSHMSKHAYQTLRIAALEHNSKLYPSYKRVLQAKDKCCPPKDDINITESNGEVKLQALLDHTVSRILSVQVDVLNCFASNEILEMYLTCKWGCDGTSGRGTFKQRFTNDDEDESDATIFCASLVPLRLVLVDRVNKKEIIIWNNPWPSSPRFCRPIKIELTEETADGTRDEASGIEDQQSKLQPFRTFVNGKEIEVSYKLALTMVDGKVCNSLASTASSQRCLLCHGTSTEFNDIDKILKKEIIKDHVEFAISPQHAWIRFFECLLHISYKLEIKRWQGDPKSIESRKRTIQKGFREQLGLLVDQPKQGYDSTNDCNTARSFFKNSSVSASITGLDEDLIKRFHVILQVISCDFEINVNKFEEYGIATARRFVLLYPWYYMPTAVHKLLIHGARIIEFSMLPIGQMSEEVQEACNKYEYSFRQDFSTEWSRKANMEYVIKRLLIASDPVISSLRKLPAKPSKSLSREAVELLNLPTVGETSDISISDSSDTDNDSDSTD